ncbi:MAG: NAD(P)H-dependent oxidoreductase [Mucilaginibacter sp.]|uniref:NADPH-dependent FMN reductase n=1 Tax=Mucilaginibacter sp. TaxID=1882438 RepID=UPI003267F99C
MNIEIISGSPRAQSLTHRVAIFLHKILNEKTEHHIGLIDVRDNPLPPIQNVFVNADAAPAEHKELSTRMFAADAFILVTPEYNGSYSPALKNLLDHFPKQHHKVFGIATASPGAFGGIRATQQLQLLVNALFGIGLPYLLVVPLVDKKFDADGNLIDATFQNQIDTFVHEFIWLAEAVVKAK